MSMESIVAALSDIGPMSAAELTTHIGLSRVTVGRQIRALRERKQVYIKEYVSQPAGTQGMHIVMYAIGSRTDAVRPPRKPVAHVNREYRRRHSAIISTRRYQDYHRSMGVWGGLL